jgi:hypothetical protein
MPESFTEKVEDRLAFDPESGGYDEVIGRMLKKKYPLIIPKPPIPDDPTQGQTVAQDTYAHEAWVWHPEDKEKKLKAEWVKHQASFDPDTKRLLKGMKHETIDKTLAGEKGHSEIYKSDDGNYYRRPIKK